MLLNASTGKQRTVTDAYKHLQIEPHVSTQAAECTVSMGSLTPARYCYNSLTQPLQVLVFTEGCPTDLTGQPSSPAQRFPLAGAP